MATEGRDTNLKKSDPPVSQIIAICKMAGDYSPKLLPPTVKTLMWQCLLWESKEVVDLSYVCKHMLIMGTGKEQSHSNMMDPPASPHPFQQGMHHQEQIQSVVSPPNQTSMAHYQTQYASYDQYCHNDSDVAQHDRRQHVISYSDEPLLTPRCPKNGLFDDSQCNFQLRINEQSIATKRSKDLKMVITCADPEMDSANITPYGEFFVVNIGVYERFMI